MAIIAPKPKSSNFEIQPAGNHVAKVYKVYHIGTAEENVKGQMKKINKIMIGFELLNEKKVFNQDKGAEPFVITAEFTLSMFKKSNLRKFVEDMLGVALQDDEADAFDVESLIGQTCLLNVVHKTSGAGNQYAKVQSATPLPKGMIAPAGHNPVQILNYTKWNQDLFDKMPEWLKDKFRRTDEYKKLKGQAVEDDDINPDEIPF